MVDEFKLHYYLPESKGQSQQWSFSPKEMKTFPSAGEVIVTIFQDSEGALLPDYFTKDQIVSGTQSERLSKKNIVPIQRHTLVAFFGKKNWVNYLSRLCPNLVDYYLFPKLKMFFAVVNLRQTMKLLYKYSSNTLILIIIKWA